jgi:hypothetical protein
MGVERYEDPAPRRGIRRRGGRRGRRGKPLAEMSTAEVRGVMPSAMAASVLILEARVAVLAIEEVIALWLAAVFALGFAGWSTLMVVRTRRRCRVRLDQLRDPITSALSVTETPLPVPGSVRLWLAAVPVLVVAALWLVARAPGAGNTCVAKGIATAGQEGICQRDANLFGAGVTFNVVDAGHVLHMPGYDAQLLTTATRVTPITNLQRSPNFYPNGTGILVCFEVAITNRGPAAITYDADGSDVGLLLQGPSSAEPDYFFADLPDANGEPGPSVATLSPIRPGQTAIGWVAFVGPQWASETLNTRATDLEFMLPSNHDADFATTNYVGQIRLWKAANTQGSQALINRPIG